MAICDAEVCYNYFILLVPQEGTKLLSRAVTVVLLIS